MKQSQAEEITPSNLGQVTLVDVARVAGVAPMTVSRALHRPELVKEATRAKVQEAVRVTGYVPNMLAGSLASNRSHLVALLLPTIASSVFADTVQALMDELSLASYQTLIGLTGYSKEREEALIESVLRRRPDAIVLVGADHSRLTVERLQRARVPVVEIWDLTTQPIDQVVGFSHERVGTTVAAHLMKLGYGRFGTIAVDDPRGQRRMNSFKAALARKGHHDCVSAELPAPATLASGREGLRRLIAAGPLPEVIFCSSDTVAAGAVQEALSRGLRIPQEIAFMGFGDLSVADQLHPRLSTVRVDGQKIGHHTARTLIRRLQGVPPDEKHVEDLGFEIIERETTRDARKSGFSKTGRPVRN
ncbi:LacI family DNA-binding transcriptional regulator [Ideonella sp. B508-1]|uniref:LacI family DNA-binding transcriptional regulator n=1 Tax=Ideonella sp. B508-1 TaxID=137716 RepID=UPI0003B40B34|nr:LacI family DNA-binding transcriptional regulator [Ideonella sp. B508-1]